MIHRIHTHAVGLETGRTSSNSSSSEHDLPDPPENLDFLELPEDFQDLVAARMREGIQRTQRENYEAKCDHARQVALMLGKRARFSRAETERKARAMVARRANKASLAEYGLRGAK